MNAPLWSVTLMNVGRYRPGYAPAVRTAEVRAWTGAAAEEAALADAPGAGWSAITRRTTRLEKMEEV